MNYLLSISSITDWSNIDIAWLILFTLFGIECPILCLILSLELSSEITYRIRRFPKVRQREMIDHLTEKLQEKESSNPVLCWLDKVLEKFIGKWRSHGQVTSQSWYKKARRALWLSGVMVFDTWDEFHCFRSGNIFHGFLELLVSPETSEQKKHRFERYIDVLEAEKEKIQGQIDRMAEGEPASYRFGQGFLNELDFRMVREYLYDSD